MKIICKNFECRSQDKETSSDLAYQISSFIMKHGIVHIISCSHSTAIDTDGHILYTAILLYRIQ